MHFPDQSGNTFQEETLMSQTTTTVGNCQVSTETVFDFMALFKGRADAWGSVSGGSNHEPITTLHYKDHLSGKTSLGVYPLLDNGNCHFFAIDLDEKDYPKALAIRQEFYNHFLPVYCADSKGKGSHIYGFCDEPFAAKDIRRICHFILDKLGFSLEVFPKQDTLDSVIPLGNYINLPSFGATRRFYTRDLKQVPIEDVLKRIIRIKREDFDKLLRIIPPPKILTPKKAKGKKKQPPPCIEAIMKGVGAGARDVAGFVLARYFLRDGLTPEAVLELLTTWDTNNSPPLDDDNLLSTKVRSASKGYKFGCASILKEPLLLNFCVGKTKCEFLHGRYVEISDTGKPRLNLVNLVKDIMGDNLFLTLPDTRDILLFDNGFWAPVGRDFIEQDAQERCGITEVLTKMKLSEICGHVERSTFKSRDVLDTHPMILNLINGEFDIATGKLSTHNPENYSTVRLPLVFDPTATCPKIERFFSEVLAEQDIQVILELFGYSTIRDNRFQKAFLFTGDGSNGKSTLLNLLQAFVGSDNVSSVPWFSLEHDRFSKAALQGKLLNLFPDLPSQSLTLTGAFKMLVGGDVIGSERKFGSFFTFTNYARLIFSANKPPKISDDSYAFWRRWAMINFPNSFKGKQANKTLLASLTTQTELSGLLNLALTGLQRLLTNDDFSYKPTVDEVQETYLRAADPVYSFLKDCCVTSADDSTPKDELYDGFKTYCEKNGIPIIRPNSFARSLQNQVESKITSYRTLVDGRQVRVWLGVAFATFAGFATKNPIIRENENM